MILSTTDTLRVELPSNTPTATHPHMTLNDCERAQICRSYKRGLHTHPRREDRTEILGLKPTTLESRMAKLGIKRAARMASPLPILRAVFPGFLHPL